jgi:hypothetical protein
MGARDDHRDHPGHGARRCLLVLRPCELLDAPTLRWGHAMQAKQIYR